MSELRLTVGFGFSGLTRRGMLAVNFRENFSLVCLCRSLIVASGIVNYLLKGTPISEALLCTW